MDAVAVTSIKQMEYTSTTANLLKKYGLSRNKIFMYANGKEPRVQKGNLKTVLGKLVDLQKPESGRGLVISYDEATDVIFVVDYQLLFYRKHHIMRWPWEEMIEEAQQKSLFDEDKE